MVSPEWHRPSRKWSPRAKIDLVRGRLAPAPRLGFSLSAFRGFACTRARMDEPPSRRPSRRTAAPSSGGASASCATPSARATSRRRCSSAASIAATGLRDGRELLGWLYRVATNLCLNALRDGASFAARPIGSWRRRRRRPPTRPEAPPALGPDARPGRTDAGDRRLRPHRRHDPRRGGRGRAGHRSDGAKLSGALSTNGAAAARRTDTARGIEMMGSKRTNVLLISRSTTASFTAAGARRSGATSTAARAARRGSSSAPRAWPTSAKRRRRCGRASRRARRDDGGARRRRALPACRRWPLVWGRRRCWSWRGRRRRVRRRAYVGAEGARARRDRLPPRRATFVLAPGDDVAPGDGCASGRCRSGPTRASSRSAASTAPGAYTPFYPPAAGRARSVALPARGAALDGSIRLDAAPGPGAAVRRAVGGAAVGDRRPARPRRRAPRPATAVDRIDGAPVSSAWIVLPKRAEAATRDREPRSAAAFAAQLGSLLIAGRVAIVASAASADGQAPLRYARARRRARGGGAARAGRLRSRARSCAIPAPRRCATRSPRPRRWRRAIRTWRSSSTTRATPTRRACCWAPRASRSTSCGRAWSTRAPRCASRSSTPATRAAWSGPRAASRRPATRWTPSSRRACSGAAIIAAGTASELAQESGDIEGSYFTHHVLSALRGAGDRDGNGVVTLAETYQYAYSHTLAATLPSSGARSTRRTTTSLAGTGDLVITRVGARAPGAVVPAPGRARVYVVSTAGDEVIAEVAAQPQGARAPGRCRAAATAWSRARSAAPGWPR